MADERRERLAQALRANLKRRKATDREHAPGEPADAGPPPAVAPDAPGA